MSELEVYILRIATSERLDEAFDFLCSIDELESCMIEPDALQIRFLAEPRVAQPVLLRIYDDGGLVWCSKHRLSADAPKVA